MATRKNNPNDAYEKEQVRIMKERAAYFKKNPAPKSNKPVVGKPTKWDNPKKK